MTLQCSSMGYWIGRVTMMKRRFQSKAKNGKAKYVQYKNKVQIDEGREQFTKDTKAVELKNLIRPCAMTYNADGDYFTISAETTAASRNVNTNTLSVVTH
jgi:hypothetical protein